MNFLAHLYLSGTNADVMTGNFLGDFVKGRIALKKYNTAIVAGIELHRGIDLFTDHHPVVQLSKNRLRPKYRHYAGVIVDMFYDHFLSAGWLTYHSDQLAVFAKHAYQNLQANQPIMPDEAKHLLPHIIRGNWLVGYASVQGIHRALSGMASRTHYDSKMEQAAEDLTLHYSEFKKEFQAFFPDVRKYAEAQILNFGF
jgi:acyl carrier protein phosphodiesterase